MDSYIVNLEVLNFKYPIENCQYLLKWRNYIYNWGGPTTNLMLDCMKFDLQFTEWNIYKIANLS